MGDPWWLPGCLENIKKLGGGKLCSEQHCTDAQNYSHKVCNCKSPYLDGCLDPKPNCCSYTATSPVFVAGTETNCYCCCGCFANGTLVAESKDKSKAIEEFQLGDMVLTADGPDLKDWSQKEVQFSSGTGDLGAFNTLIKIDFGNTGEEDYIYASRDQLFLMPDKKLKRASRLVPGKDELLRPDGTTTPVQDLVVGKFKKGVHHIATSDKPASSMKGHLLSVKGIVCGDYSLQICDLTKTNSELMVDGHDELPEFGTKEYIETYKHLAADVFKTNMTEVDPAKQPSREEFEPLGAKKPVHIPEHAQYFVTKVQAEDIKENAPHSPPDSGAGVDITNYLFKLFKGFYPEVTFYLDENNDTPNAYSFFEYDKPFVVITGRLLRTHCVMFESLALIIAHELGHLYGGKPQDRHGYTCAGMADFVAISAVIPEVWFGYYSINIVKDSIEQIRKLFEFISPKHREGIPGNKCSHISIDCRLKSIENASQTQQLPMCAGGTADPYLEVIGASASMDQTGRHVTVEFNTTLDKDSAEALGNYSFNPHAKAFSAKLDYDNPSQVVVTLDIEIGIEYEVTVFDVMSSENQPLVPGKNKAAFQLNPSQ